MRKIVNLTQHTPTPEQLAAGVFNPPNQEEVKNFLTFNILPTKAGIKDAAYFLALFAQRAGATHALIGGAPYLMGALESALKAVGIQPLYAFSERHSVEVTNPDGTVTKTNVFKHVGFIEV